MNYDKEYLLHRISRADLVVLEVFGTLIHSMINDRETMYDLIGKKFKIHGFRKLRIDAQKKADSIAYAKEGCLCAEIDQIYKLLSQHRDIRVDWDAVKSYELAMEKDAAVADPDIKNVLKYAKDQGKKVVAVCDMHFSMEMLTEMFSNAEIVFGGVYTAVTSKCVDDYCDFLAGIFKKEQVPVEKVFYIYGDASKSSVSRLPQGLQTFLYEKDKIYGSADAGVAEIDGGLYRILHDVRRGFWYNLGLEIGGPMYLGLYLWFEKIVKDTDKTVYFVSKNGYNLWQLLVANGFDNVVYLYNDFEDWEKRVDYWKRSGFFDADNIVFDAGWDGSLQYQIEEIKQKNGCPYNSRFYYFGVRSGEKSSRQLHGRQYDAYAFDFYRNYTLQFGLDENEKLWELFFSAPQGLRKDILDGIRDYMRMGLPFAKQYVEGYIPSAALAKLLRFMQHMTVRETLALLKEGIEFKPYIPSIDPNYDQDFWDYHRMSLAKKKNQLSLENGGGREQEELQYNPKFSVVIPVYNTESIHLKAAIESVLAQTYDNYELILVDDHSTWDNVAVVLKSYESDPHVHVIFRETNGHISVATNDGIAVAGGEFIIFMDCDDVIEPQTFYLFAQKLNENPELDFIYSDEDKITEEGDSAYDPHYKPEWSESLFASEMYTSHLAMYRRSIVLEIGGLRTEYNGSQDYDMTLRFMEKSSNKRVGHVDKVLYHWRARRQSVAFNISAKSYALEAARCAKEDALQRRGFTGTVEEVTGTTQYRVVYEPPKDALVSIVIPSRDNFEMLKQCIDSICGFTDCIRYEIIVVDNGSTAENKNRIQDYLKGISDAVYLYDCFEFNYSEMCNRGVSKCHGDFVLFLHDDVEVFQRDWLKRLVGQGNLPEIGAVGAKLLYPYSNIVQHGGIASSNGRIIYEYQLWNDIVQAGIGSYNWMDHECMAVTGACMLVRKELFERLGGFDEEFSRIYGDVAFCFKLYEMGYYSVIRNDVCAYHHKALEEDKAIASDEPIWMINERQKLYQKYPQRKYTDPYLNKNFKNNHLERAILDDMIDSSFNPKEKMYSLCEGGYWDECQEYVWTKPSFRVWIRNPRIHHLGLCIRIATWHNNYKLQDPDTEPKIRLLIDKGYICDIPVENGGAEYRIPMDLHEDDLYEVRLEANCYFVPKKICKGDDIRTLAMTIYYIGD